jgi:hypothetical protein
MSKSKRKPVHRPAPPGDAPADAPFTNDEVRDLMDLIEEPDGDVVAIPASPLLAEPPPAVPIEPGAGVLLRKRPEIPQHLVLKPHQCPRCRAAMAVYGNFGVCGCGYKGRIA